MRKAIPILAALSVVALAGAPFQEALTRLQRSAEVFHEIMSAPDGGVPDAVLRHTQCVMIVPGLKKAGLGVGGEFGRGIVSCRVAEGWSSPLFITVGGGSFGLQIGAEQTDLVMLIMNRDGENYLLKDKFSLGGDMAATAGPVGRDAAAQTDVLMHAKMLTYSRAKGLFGGITLKGAVISQDKDTNAWLYKTATPDQILNGKTPAPSDASSLITELSKRGGSQ